MQRLKTSTQRFGLTTRNVRSKEPGERLGGRREFVTKNSLICMFLQDFVKARRMHWFDKYALVDTHPSSLPGATITVLIPAQFRS